MVSSNGYTKIDIARTGLFTKLNQLGAFEQSSLIELIASTQRIRPISNDPESPINILAGEKLKIRNPNNEPDKTNAKSDSGTFPEK